MKIEIHLSQPELQNRVIQMLSDAQLLDKVELRTPIEPCQPRSEQRHVQTKRRVCLVERQEDNTLICSACAQKLPATHQGDLDLDRIAFEIAARQW